MSTDAKWIVGTGAAVVVSVVGSAVAVFAVMAVLVGDVSEDVRDVRADVRDFRTEMSARMEGFDARLRAVEVAFGKVDQRLATLERLHLPTPAGDGD